MNDVATRQSDSLLNFIERASRDPEFDINKFEALLRMQREVLADQAKREFNAAMASAQAEMEPVRRDAQNSHTKSRYARLETIDAQMRPIYTKHGFSVRYGSGEAAREGWQRVTCTVAHAGGYYEEHHLDSPPDMAGAQGTRNKTPVQAIGSTISYLRRYLLCMVFNVVVSGDDDDGAATSREAPPSRAADNRFYREPQRTAAPPDMDWGPPVDVPPSNGQPKETELDLGGDGLPDDLAGRKPDALEIEVETAINNWARTTGRASFITGERETLKLIARCDYAKRSDLAIRLGEAMESKREQIFGRRKPGSQPPAEPAPFIDLPPPAAP